MSTFIASFPDVPSAQTALRSLLGDGVSADDLSLIGYLEGNGKRGEIQPDLGRVGDASSVVGRSDDPISDVDGIDGIRFQAESNIGGGIATSSSDDNVSSVDEMDDSQSAEEDLLSPLEVGTIGAAPDHDADETLDTLSIPGFGLVMGGGALATTALDFADLPVDESRKNFRTYLEGEGVPREIAATMLKQIEDGGAVLAVAIIPGETNPNTMEELATSTGATRSGLFDSPRY